MVVAYLSVIDGFRLKLLPGSSKVILRNTFASSFDRSHKKIVLVIASTVIGSLSPVLIEQFNTAPSQLIKVANADSTGKMSTKLTARKRYLPRVIKGEEQFRALSTTGDKAAVDAFIADELAGMKRAMNLYGASLRKGEVPDEISREAEKLTEVFFVSVGKIPGTYDKTGASTAATKSGFEASGSALQSFISYCKIDEFVNKK